MTYQINKHGNASHLEAFKADASQSKPATSQVQDIEADTQRF